MKFSKFKLKFKTKEVIELPSDKKIVLIKSYGHDLKTPQTQQRRCIIPDRIDGIYAMVGDGTYFKDIAEPKTTKPYQAYDNMEYGIKWINLNRAGYAGAVYDNPVNYLGLYIKDNSYYQDGISKIAVGKTKDNMVEIPLYFKNGVKNPNISTYTPPINEKIKSELIDLGFSENNASILSRGGIFAYVNHGYILFSDFITENFCWDFSRNGILQKVHKQFRMNVIESGTINSEQAAKIYGDELHKAGYTYTKIPPLTAGLAKNVKYNGKTYEAEDFLYLPTITLTKEEYTQKGKNAFPEPDMAIKEKLIQMGICQENAEIFSRGVVVTILKYSNSYLDSGIKIRSYLYDTLKKDSVSINTSLYQGDYNYLEELEEG